MTAPTPEIIARLRELDAARTQGEWTVDRESPDLPVLAPDTPGFTWDGVFVCTTALDSASEPNAADAEFIAAAANALPGLLDEIEDLRRYRDMAEPMMPRLSWLEGRVAAVLAHNALEIRDGCGVNRAGRRELGDEIASALAQATQREEGEG